jgi:hypothetical protein
MVFKIFKKRQMISKRLDCYVPVRTSSDSGRTTKHVDVEECDVLCDVAVGWNE